MFSDPDHPADLTADQPQITVTKSTRRAAVDTARWPWRDPGCVARVAPQSALSTGRDAGAGPRSTDVGNLPAAPCGRVGSCTPLAVFQLRKIGFAVPAPGPGVGRRASARCGQPVQSGDTIPKPEDL